MTIREASIKNFNDSEIAKSMIFNTKSKILQV